MRIRCRAVGWLVQGLLLAHVVPVAAHEVRPAYLQIREEAGNQYDVLWKQPASGELAIRLIPHLSNGWLEHPPSGVEATPGFLIRHWHVQADGVSPLEGTRLSIEGLKQSITNVLIDIRLSNGEHYQTIVDPDRAWAIVHFKPMDGLPTLQYFVLGVEHILTGIDHLMFVLGLLMLAKTRWQLLKTITAFTLAHSITLALTALGVLNVYPPLIEALVALSIAFLAVELVRSYRGVFGVTARYPWIIAFTFGLLHGAAFAGALAEVGLPPEAIPASLLLFNLGVETGQILFVWLVLALIQAIRILPTHIPLWFRWVPPYVIGSFSAVWFIQRIVTVFS